MILRDSKLARNNSDDKRKSFGVYVVLLIILQSFDRRN